MASQTDINQTDTDNDDSKKKPHAPSCDRNTAPIIEVLKDLLAEADSVLEIGSGTGQHAVAFGRAFPHLTWQPSDLEASHEAMKLWLEEAALPNVQSPLLLDVSSEQWPETQYEVVFTANTLHIMPESAVELAFRGIARVLNSQGKFIVYGPFMYGGQHTSDSNVQFDQWLKEKAPHQGIREMEWLKELADEVGLVLEQDIEMPANNRMLVWRLSI